MIGAVGAEEAAASPDGRHVAKISSEWRARFFGGAPREIHDVRVESKGGEVIRRVVTNEAWLGWPKDTAISWTADGSAVSVRFNTEALSTQLNLKVLR